MWKSVNGAPEQRKASGRHPFWRYAAAVGAVAAGWAIRAMLRETLGASAPYITLFPAVMFTAWFAGFGPAILATMLAILTVAFVIAPGQPEIVRATIFAMSSVFFGAIVDGLRRARLDAERTRDLLQTTLSSIGDGVIATDASGTITFLNEVAQRLTGWNPSEAKGRPIGEVFVIRHETTGQPAEDPVAKVIRDRKVAILANHTILLDRSGRGIPIEDTAAPILDASQHLFGVVLVFRDVTAHRRGENELKQTAERLKLVLDAGQIGAWDWNLAQNRIEWSEHVYNIHRIERGGFRGSIEEYAQLVHPDDRERVQRAIDDTLHRNAPYELSFRVVRPSGEVRWIHTLGRAIRDEKGVAVRMLGAVTDITAQRQSDEKMRQQWATFDTALSNTPDHQFILDSDGRFTYANQAMLNLWRRPFEEVAGKNFFELDYPPEVAARLLNQVQNVVMSARPVRDQAAFTAPSGETRNYEYILVPAFAPSGEVEAVAGSSRDMTERIATERSLRESEERLHFALEAGGAVGAWDWDIPANRVMGNPPFAAQGEAAPIEHFIAGIHADDRERISASLRAATESGANFSEEYRIPRPQGGDLWVFARGRCYKDEAGNPSRFPCVAFDITDRKLAENSLRESQERLLAIYDGTCEFMGLLAPDGTLLEANRASLEFARSARDQLVGRKFWDTPWFSLTPGAAETARQAVTSAAAGEFVRYEALIRDADGSAFFFDISYYPVRDAAGAVILIVPEGRNITGLKRAEQELIRANAELTRVNRDLEDFAYVASHDMRESLRMVNIHTQLLLKDLGDGDAKLNRYAATIRQGVTQMDGLLTDLLKFSRAVHSGDPPVGAADLSAALAEALAVLESRIAESGAAVDAPQSLPLVRGETTQLVHVFQNLISNSLKYSRAGVAPRVRIRAESQPGGEWIVSIRDNGIGFPPEKAGQIFGLFKRLHESEEYEGSGLGLSICQRIVERYGGRIWAESTPGEGSTFHLQLTAAEDSKAATSAAAPE